VAKNTLQELYTQKDLQNARTKGQLVGWVQGAALGVGGVLLLGVIGWIPTLVVLGVGGFLLYKVFSSPSKTE